MKREISLRMARVADASTLLKLYSYYIENTAITFEYMVPTLLDFSKRIEKTLKRYPYLVALVDGRIVGYAYAGPLKERAAYDWSAELSIYMDPACKRMGLGRMLYGVLEELLKKQGIRRVYACISCLPEETPELPLDSISFHESMGFVTVGKFMSCGSKFDNWYDMVWMEKVLAPCEGAPAAIVPIGQLEGVDEYLRSLRHSR